MPDFIKELTRRNMFRVAIAYIIVGWVILQVADVIAPTLELPDWSMRLVLFLLALGFPISLLVAWGSKAGGEETADSESEATISNSEALVAPPEAPPRPPAMSVAVLPFNNLLGAADLEYLVDGFSEDLTTLLDGVLFPMYVTGRNSAFAYKGQSPDLREVGKDLNVRYIVEGSLRKMGENVRVTYQLIECESGNHVSSGKYDEPLEDLLESNDEISMIITHAVSTEMFGSEMRRLRSQKDGDLTSTELLVLGFSHAYDPITPEGIPKAIEILERALALDENEGKIHGHIAQVYSFAPLFRVMDFQEAVKKARIHISKALQLDVGVAESAGIAAMIHYNIGEHEQALRHANRAVEYHHHAYSFGAKARAELGLGRYEEALEDADHAIKLAGPKDFNFADFKHIKGYILLGLKRFEDAEAIFQENLLSLFTEWNNRGLITALVQQGKIEEARKLTEHQLKLAPFVDLAFTKETLRLQHWQDELNEMVIDALVQTGMPEHAKTV